MTEYTYIAESLQPLAVPIADLHEDPANARIKHDIQRIKASLSQYGQRKPIVANKLENGKIEAGNGTFRAAKELGWTHIAVVFVEDDPVVAAAYGIADNRVGEFSEWDEEVLKSILQTTGDLYTGFEPAELEELVGVSTATAKDVNEADAMDRAEELQEKWKVEVGQVYRLDKHRLMCGDSTQQSDVKRLMGNELAHLIWSDPPWNVDYGGSDHPAYDNRTMNNDNLGEKFIIFVDLFVTQFRSFCFPGAAVYVVMGGQEWPVIDAALRKAGFHWSSTIIWVKDQLVFSRKDYHTQYEPMWYGWDDRAPRLMPLEDRKQSDVWEIDRPKKSDEHPTMKPLELVERSLLNSSRAGDIVLDLFAGSGTTLRVAEKTKRICRTMEQDPKYAAVCLELWHKMTGIMPELEVT